MEKLVLKEQMKELIAGRKVKAALFYTFNFDPYFFENYVMPLLVPGQNFRDEAVYNAILWRRCAKERLIPPVTIYCDHYAKDNTVAPTLGYQVRCIRMKGKKHSIVNFHPKECWLLFENDELIQFNTSANLTPSGWCENLECCASLQLVKNSYPKTVSLNCLQRMINSICALSAEQQLSESERLLQHALRYTDDTNRFFSSLDRAFLALMNELIRYLKPAYIEIISPYMNGQGMLIEALQSQTNAKIRCLVPSLKTNEVLLGRETFIEVMERGATWCVWADKQLAGQPRNLHAKIYRLYSAERTVTITGSVNFTSPAWGKCTADGQNEANAESALIHEEGPSSFWLEPLIHIDLDRMTFLSREDVNTSEMTSAADRNAPMLQFSINWKAKKLYCSGKLQKNERVRFKELLAGQELTQARLVYDLQPEDILHLSKNSLIELTSIREPIQIFAYYPTQLEIESRPFNFRLNPDSILGFWLSGGDTYVEDELAGKIAEDATDESGMVSEVDMEASSLLNEMARHFAALVSLEKRLFGQQYSDRVEQFHALGYYLLTENLDTIPFYLKSMADKSNKKLTSASFAWMLRQVLITRFYERAAAWPYRSAAGKNWRSFKADLEKKRAVLITECTLLSGQVTGLKNKADWISRQIGQIHG